MAQVIRGGNSSRLLISWDKFDVLDATTVGNSNSIGDSTIRQSPKTNSIGSLDTKSRLENGDRNGEVRSKDQVVLEIDRDREMRIVRREYSADRWCPLTISQ